MSAGILIVTFFCIYSVTYSQLVPEFKLTECENALTSVLRGEYPNSALMMDSSGKSINELGKFDDCKQISNAQYCLVTVSNSKIPNVNSFLVGTCVPKTCSSTELTKALTRLVATNISSLFGGYSVRLDVKLVVGELLPIPVTTIPLQSIENPPTFNASCEPPSIEMSLSGKFFLFTFFLLVAFCVIGSLLDHLLPKNGEKLVGDKTTEMVPLNISDEKLTNLDDEIQEFEQTNDQQEQSCIKCRLSREHLFVRIFLAFSIQHNVSRLVVPSPQATRFLDGIRTLSMFYVILGHVTFFLNFVPILNPISFFTKIFPSLSFQIIMGGFFAVDSFYYLSGFFVTLGVLPFFKIQQNISTEMDTESTQTTNTPNIKTFFVMYFHRWLRLTPLYLFLIWFFSELMPLIGDGPLFYIGSGSVFSSDHCRKYWWSNILYINNYVPWNENLSQSCFQWGWYLSNDFQFFLLTPILLMIFSKHKIIGTTVMSVFVIASYIVVGSLIWVKDIKFGNPEWTDLYYTKPWTRIPPYFIGVALALFWKAKPVLQITLIQRILLQVISTCLLLITIFGTYTMSNPPEPGWSIFERFFYWTFSRTAFVTGLSLISLLALHGHVPAVTWFLSFRLWSPAARLTFAAYLIHPIIILIIYVSTRTPMQWDPWQTSIRFCGIVVLTYALALFLWLLVEKPLQNLEKIFFNFSSGKNSEQASYTKEKDRSRLVFKEV